MRHPRITLRVIAAMAIIWPLLASGSFTPAIGQDAGLASPEASAVPDPEVVPDPAGGIAGDPVPTTTEPGDGLRQTTTDPLLDQAAATEQPSEPSETVPAADQTVQPASDDFQAPSQIAPEEPAETPPPAETVVAPDPGDDVADATLAEPAVADESAVPADAPPPPVVADEPEPQQTIVAVPPPIDPAPFEEEDIYAPLGYKVGAFRLFPAIESELQYTDNILKSQAERRSDSALAFRPSLLLDSQWERHDLELSLDGERSFHRSFSSEDDNSIDAELRGRLDITSITNVEGDLGYSFDQLERGSIEGAEGLGDRQSQREMRYGATFNQRLNHFTIRLRGVVTHTDETAPELTIDPALCAPSNPNPPAECDVVGQDYADRQVALRLGYEFYEGFEVFADGDRHWRKFASLDGEPLGVDSHGFTLRGGISAELGPVWRGFLAAGIAEETPEDRRIAALRGTVVEAQLVWTPSVLTTLTFSAERGITTTTIDDTAGSVDTTVAIDLRHELRRYWAILAGYAYGKSEFSGLGETETERIAYIGTEYDIDRTWSLSAEYRYIDLESDGANESYNENQFRIGLRAQR